MSDVGYAWCQECKRWVPANKMNYFNGMRVCEWCLNGEPTPDKYFEEPHHEGVQCIYCDSWDTIEVAPEWGKYKCRECGETFRRLF